MNAPAPLEMKTAATKPMLYAVVPLIQVHADKVQFYFQTLYSHDTLKYRFSDFDNPMWEDVVDVIRRMGRSMYLVVDDKGLAVADFALEHFTGQAAQMHFSFHPGVPTKEKLRIARFVHEYCLIHWKNPKTGKPFLMSLYGLTPVPNRVACIFALKAGFKKMGVLPGGVTYFGQSVDAMISYCTKEILDGRR